MAKSATVNPSPASEASRPAPGKASKAAGRAQGQTEPAILVGLGLSADANALYGGGHPINESTAVGRSISPREFFEALSSGQDQPAIPGAVATVDLLSDLAEALFAEAPALLLLLQTETWSNFAAHLVVKQGISSKLLVPLGEFLGLNKAELADFLELDRGTIHRRIQMEHPLPSHAAESVLRLLELDRMAKDTFATDEDAAGWMRKSHPMLAGETPLEAAKTSFGAERVKEILIALKLGGVA